MQGLWALEFLSGFFRFLQAFQGCFEVGDGADRVGTKMGFGHAGPALYSLIEL